MRKGRDGESGEMKKKKKKKIMAEIVATTLLPVDRLTAINCNAATRAKMTAPFSRHLKMQYYLPVRQWSDPPGQTPNMTI